MSNNGKNKKDRKGRRKFKVKSKHDDFCPCLPCLGITQERADQLAKATAEGFQSTLDSTGPQSMSDLMFISRMLGVYTSTTVAYALASSGHSVEVTAATIVQLESEFRYGASEPGGGETVSVMAEPVMKH